MGLTYATLEVINATDNGMARRNLMPEADIRRTQVRMLVDSGAYMLCLNEHLQAQLGLDIIDSMEGELDRKSTRLNSSHERRSRMPSSA